jgi:hypothetical protein
MKKFALSAVALGFALCVTAALAQLVTPTAIGSVASNDLFQDIPRGLSAATNVYASASQLRSWFFSQNSQHTGTPALTTSTSICGGSTAALTSGNDYTGQVAEGSSASTSCVITFATPYVTAPECYVSLNGVADTALKCSASTTALTITQTSASSNVLNYLVIGLSGG